MNGGAERGVQSFFAFEQGKFKNPTVLDLDSNIPSPARLSKYPSSKLINSSFQNTGIFLQIGYVNYLGDVSISSCRC